MDQDNIARWVEQISKELSLPVKNVKAVATLLSEDATIPFIARYRKEMTGSMDEVMISKIRDRIEQLDELDKRREAIITSIEKQDKLTPELMKTIVMASTLAELEDIYLPFKPKRKTRASAAKEKGLEPLAKRIFDQEKFNLEEAAATFIDAEKGVSNVEKLWTEPVILSVNGSTKIRIRAKMCASYSGAKALLNPGY